MENKSSRIQVGHTTFNERGETCPLVHINNMQLPQEDDVKYLGLYLARRLTWQKHILAKWKQLGIAINKMYWLLGRKSKLSTKNKLLLYITILKPIWGRASASNIEILEHFQSQALSMIADAAWYVPNMVIQRDLQILTVKEGIRSYSSQYSPHLSTHPHDLTANLIELPDNKRLRRHLPNYLPTRILVYLFICNPNFLGLVCKFYSQKPQEASNLLVTEECASEHSSTCPCIRFYTICWMY
jgi:hypothetical protein